MNAVREQLIGAGVSVITKLQPGSAAAVIAQSVKSEGIDLLAMGAYGHSKLREFIVGSKTTKIIRSSSVPVLMFR